jgi:hypothetical protein
MKEPPMIRMLTLGLVLLTVLAAPATARIDPRPDARGPAVAQQDLRSPDSRDAALGRKIVVVPVTSNRRPAEAAGGFDWSDAALGSGITAGLMLLLGGVGALTLFRGRSESQHAARI